MCIIDIDVDMSGKAGTEGGENKTPVGPHDLVGSGGRNNPYWQLSLTL